MFFGKRQIQKLRLLSFECVCLLIWVRVLATILWLSYTFYQTSNLKPKTQHPRAVQTLKMPQVLSTLHALQQICNHPQALGSKHWRLDSNQEAWFSTVTPKTRRPKPYTLTLGSGLGDSGYLKDQMSLKSWGPIQFYYESL